MCKILLLNRVFSSLFSLIQQSNCIMWFVNHTCAHEWGMRKKKRNSSFAKLAVYVCREIHKLQWLFWTSDSKGNHIQVIEIVEDENPRANPVDSSVYTESILTPWAWPSPLPQPPRTFAWTVQQPRKGTPFSLTCSLLIILQKESWVSFPTKITFHHSPA